MQNRSVKNIAKSGVLGRKEVNMFFKQRINNDFSISYFFGCVGKGQAIAVDVAAGDELWYITESSKLNVTITLVIDTHIHADHLSGCRNLANLTGALYVLHESNKSKTNYIFTPVSDNAVLEAGNTQVKILHTPGHTEDSICLLVSDLSRGEMPWFVITGDTLFVGAVGRPDLAGQQEKMAAKLWTSLHEKILALPNELEIFPGHQAGSTCGNNISGKPSSTIGFEKRLNPLLSLDKEAFIKTIISYQLIQPINMKYFIASNLGYASEKLHYDVYAVSDPELLKARL